MFRMLRSFLSRWADASLTREVGRLEKRLSETMEQLNQSRSLVAIKDLEITELTAVITRNHKRVEVESAIAARDIAIATHAGRQ